MTLKELQRLKKLDITTLPVSEWNDAKSVLGLDAEKDVIMSATDEFATQQQVEDALVSANTYTDAAIEGLHIPTKTSDLENDSDFATEEYVDAAVTAVTLDSYTKEEADEKFATKEEVPSLDGYATENWVTGYTYDKGTIDDKIASGGTFDPENYYTKAEVDDIVTAATEGLATEAYVDAAVSSVTVDAYTKAESDVKFATKEEIPSLDGYATEAYVTAATQGLASEEYVDAAITAATDDMATQTWVQSQGYLTEHQDISGKLDKTDFDTYTGATAEVLAEKADKSEIPSLDGYATEAYVDAAVTAGTAGLASESYVDAAVTAGTQDMATQTWVGQQGYITDAALEGYATESGVTAAITAATDDMATQTWVGQQGYITNSALEGYATESGVTAAITAATEGLASEDYVDAAVTAGTEGLASEQYVDAAITAATEDQATKTWVGQQGYITDAALEGYATESGVTAAITAATDDMATQTYVSGFTYDKDTIDEKIASGGTFDPTNYYTKSQVDNIVTAATDGLASESYVDAAVTAGTQDMATQTWVGQQGYITDAALEGYATESGVTAAITAATDDMATQTWVNEQGFLTEHQDISGKLDKSDFNTYTGATADEIAAKLDKTDFNTYTGATATVLEGKADISDIPDVSNFVTSGEVETQITSKGYITDAALAGYATESGVTNTITAATEGLASEDYVTAAVTAGTQDMATKTWVGQQGYITNEALEGYATESGVTAAITAATDDMATETWVGNQGYLTQHQSLAGLAASVSYDSSAKTIYFYDKDGTVLNTNIDTTDFVKDGMVNNVEIVNGNLVITFNTDAGKEAITIPLTDIFDPSNYYTKTEVDAAITAATEGLASESYVDSAITAATDDLASESYVDAAVTAGTQDMATQTWVQNQGYLTEHQDISGKLDVSDFDTYTGATATVLEGKADISDIPDVSNFVTSGDVETQITSKGYITDAALAGYATESGVTAAITAATDGLASEEYVDAAVTAATEDMATKSFVTGITSGLQETLVSGTNIKTINNESILGSGNITVQMDVDDNFSTGSTNPVENRVITNEMLYLEYCINEKQDELVSGTNIKTVNNQSLLGSGNISVTITVDDSLSTGSTNPVQNKVVTAALNNKANTTDIPDVSNFVTSGDVETQITSKGYITDAALAGYATESGVTAAITAATDDMATQTWVGQQGYITDAALAGYATESGVTNAITAATNDMATETWVQSQGYLTEHQDISGKLDVSDFDTYTGATATVLEGKADISDIPDVSNFVTSGDVETQITSKGYITDAALAGYATESGVTAAITAATDGLASESYVDAAVTAGTQDMATQTWVGQQGYITDAGLAGYATESGVTAAITAATDDMATQTWVGQQGYMSQSDVDTEMSDSSTDPVQNKVIKAYADTKAKVISLTQAEYDALSGNTESGTTYYITDAPALITQTDLTAAITAATQGLATESGVTEALAEKADIATTSTTVYETTSTVITGFTTPWSDNRYVIISGSAVDLTGVTENGESSDWYVVYNANGLSGNFYLSNNTVGTLSFGNYETVTNPEIGKVYNFGNLTSGSIAVPALVLNGEKYVFVRMNYDDAGGFESYDAMVSNSLTLSEVKNVVYGEMPTAQDGSGVNYFVYNGSGSKGVVAGISSSYSQFSDKVRLFNMYRLWDSNNWYNTYVDIPPVDSTNAGVATPAMLSEILKVSAATNVQGTHVIGTGDTGYKASIMGAGAGDIPFYEADGGAYAIATIEFASLNQSKSMILSDPEQQPMGFAFGSSTQFFAASLPATITYDDSYTPPPLPLFSITNNTTTANKTVYLIMDMSTKDVEITDTLSYTGGQKTLATTDLVATALQYAIAMAQSIVNSAVANKVVGTGITNITKISRSDYESLATKDSNTLYVIED